MKISTIVEFLLNSILQYKGNEAYDNTVKTDIEKSEKHIEEIEN